MMEPTERSKDDEIIASALDAIAADGNSVLIAPALREAWTGRGFDENVLRDAFRTLAAEENE